MNNKKEYQRGIAINPNGNGSTTCMRGKSCKDGCEFYDRGFCRGVCYPTYPPKYKRCNFENNGNASQQYFTDEEINGFKGETNEPNRIEAAAERLLAQKEQPINAAVVRGKDGLPVGQVAVKNGVFAGDYGNRFAVVAINLGGYRFVIHADHSGFRPRIKIEDQNEVLNRVADELVDCINKGAAVIAAPTEPPSDAAKMREALEAVKVAFDSGTIGPVGNYPPARLVAKAGKVMEKVEKALATPARNCDVDTTEEKN